MDAELAGKYKIMKTDSERCRAEILTCLSATLPFCHACSCAAICIDCAVRFQFLKDWLLSSASGISTKERIVDVASDENKDRYRLVTCMHSRPITAA